MNSKNKSASKMKQADRDDVSRPIFSVDPDLVEAIVTYAARFREWRGYPDMLFTEIGQPSDDEAVLVDLLTGVEDALAERGIAMEITGGHVVLTRIAGAGTRL